MQREGGMCEKLGGKLIGVSGTPTGGGWGCRGVGFGEDDNVIHLGHQEKVWVGGVKICPLW